MKTNNNSNHSSTTTNGVNAADPQTAPVPTPLQLVDQIRLMQKSIPDIAPLTPVQRRALRQRARATTEILQAQITIVGASDVVEQAVGQPEGDVRQMVVDESQWALVEDELKALVAGVEGANLLRREKLAFVAGQAYRVGVSLLGDPEHKAVVPHVQEVRRLKRIASRKKKAPAPQPEPQPNSQGGSGT
jgi:hypothetical protein